MENKDKPAVPLHPEHSSKYDDWSGLTKREMIAAMCLQGLLANPEFLRTRIDRSPVEEAIKWTDDFLTQIENK